MRRHVLLAALLPALCLVPACRPSEGADTPGAHTAAPEFPSRAITQFTAKSELFAEHKFLVIGKETGFAAHLTDLKDFSPVTEGRLVAILKAQDGRQVEFPVQGVERPGIFRPVVKPEAPGTYALSFRLTSPRLTDTIPAGEVTVYQDEASAMAAAPKEEPDLEEISYLKEQQWKISFATQPVARGIIEGGRSLSAEVKAAGGQEVSIAAPAPGRLLPGLGRLPQLGEHVRKGEELAVLVPAGDAGQDLASLKQAVASAEATLQQAKKDLARATRLVTEQAAPERRREEARTVVVVAEATLAAARRQLNAKQASLKGDFVATEEAYRLRAPLSGTVVEAKLVPGSFVSEGTPLYRLVNMERVWVEARVPEKDLARLSSATRAEVTVSGEPTVKVGNGQGGLVTVGSVLDPANRTAPVVFSMPNPHGRYRIGMTAQLRMLTGQTLSGVVIPTSAVVDDNGKPIAFVQTGGESFERRELQLGDKQGERVQVVSGLAEGERVVIKGGYEIRLSTLSDAVPAHGHAH